MKTSIRYAMCALPCLAMSTSALAKARAVDAEPQDPFAAAPDRNAATSQIEVTEPKPADGADDRLGFHFSLGGLLISPTGRSGEVEMANVSAQAGLAGMSNGPIAGSYTSMGRNLMPGAIIGYAPPILDRQLSIETVLALPFTQKLYAGGTLATNPLGGKVLNVLSTGVPPLGDNLGEVKALPPVVTAVYRFFPGSAVRPYIGLGACVMIILDAKITNPVLTEVGTPKLEVPPKVGWVAQAGLDVRIYGSFFFAADFKYIGGLDITSTVKDIWIRVPDLPIYGSVKVGDNIAHTSVDPIVVHLGLGMEL